ncbi:MAG TPA: LppP/LprE family lipoprotein [Jatrophihabitantaceae bacterium]|nr:LppP/LprE family lipoprotein [Jatrophihabitantaceae bacterium]
MNDIRQLETRVRAAMVETEQRIVEPAGLADRLIVGATARSSSALPLRARRHNGWMTPMLAAAAVVVATAGALFAVHAAQQRSPATHPTPTVGVSPTVDLSPRPGPTTPQPHPSTTPASRVAAPPPTANQIREVMKSTEEIGTPGEYFAPTGHPVTVDDGRGGTLTAAIGSRTPNADGHGMVVFFWHDATFISWDSTTEATTTDAIASAGSGEVRVTYDNYATHDAACCPSLPPATVTFQWSGDAVVALSAIPSGVYMLASTGVRPVEVRLDGAQPTQANGLWAANSVLITGGSLGGVRIGMSLTGAAQAAGVSTFTVVGDGVYLPGGSSGSTDPVLYLGNFAGKPASTVGGSYSCVGATLTPNGVPTRQVITSKGIRLGDPAARVRAAYGSAAIFEPLPGNGGIDPHAGYVVHDGLYDLVFKLNTQNQQVTGIAGGLAPLTPSECNS